MVGAFYKTHHHTPLVGAFWKRASSLVGGKPSKPDLLPLVGAISESRHYIPTVGAISESRLFSCGRGF